MEPAANPCAPPSQATGGGRGGRQNFARAVAALKKASTADAQYKRDASERALLLAAVQCYREADARLTEAIASPETQEKVREAMIKKLASVKARVISGVLPAASSASRISATF